MRESRYTGSGSDVPETKSALNGYFGTVSAFWKLVKDYGFPAAVKKLTSAQQRAARLFPVWAVNNLSVRNALPLQPALFDLVVIDEASQCDLASAVPSSTGPAGPS
ncbi:hypothetical protein [Rubrivirga litoralis]|uniref:DNA2/NAM7 helicase helicase domain-containing protein n=1 Tax=Rubrivirga litoralis TaxID=3075598 RepID=A0ABU3BU95_9BACT|nr:hypothetical protein [Rubrivirga sp. F394]MDT0632868.1 hypothetical protein [Rubrivirga sp. F394]